MNEAKWQFNEGAERDVNWVALPDERIDCKLTKITECTINYKKYGLKHAIRVGFTPTHEALAELGIQLGEDDYAYITKTMNLATGERSSLWKTLKLIAEPDEVAHLKPTDAAGIQAAYEALIGRRFEVINQHNNGFNNAQMILKIKGAAKEQLEQPVKAEAEPTGFEDMPNKTETPDSISFDDDDISF